MDVRSASAWRAAGVSRAQFAKMVAVGELVRIRYGAYATAGIVAEAAENPALSHALHVAGARCRIHGGVASHHSAALMRGFSLLNEPPDGTVTLTVPPGTRTGPYGRAGVIRHTAELPGTQVTTLFGVPVTAPGRTVVDIARTSPFMDGVVVADQAIHNSWTSKADLNHIVTSCTGWPGIGQARRVVEFANGLAESVFESCARVIFHEHGLPPPKLQVKLYGEYGNEIARVDFFWGAYGVVAESDGLLKYKGGEVAIAELRRDRLLREAGFEVVHFTWEELFAKPERVIARIREAFARALRLRHGLFTLPPPRSGTGASP